MSFFNLRLGKSKKSSSTTLLPLYLQSPHVDASLVTGRYATIVQLPPHLSSLSQEWIAVNTFDFFQFINLLYGTCSEACTPASCPVMCAGSVEWPWIDTQKKSNKVSAPQYVDSMMTSIQNQIDDESIFPTKAGVEFSKDFLPTVKSIFKHFLRLFAHIYHHHYDTILNLEQEAHLNTLLGHVVAFGLQHDLVDKKDLQSHQLGPLVDQLSPMFN